MRYDGILKNHHHLYCAECDHIEDYENKKLDEIMEAFLQKISLTILYYKRYSYKYKWRFY